MRFSQEIPSFGYQFWVIDCEEDFGHVFGCGVHDGVEDEDVVEDHAFEEEDPQGGFDAFFGEFLPLDEV